MKDRVYKKEEEICKSECSRMIYPSNEYKDFYPTKKQIIAVLKIMKKHEYITGKDLKRCSFFLKEFRWDKFGYIEQNQTIPRIPNRSLETGYPFCMFIKKDTQYTLNDYNMYLYHRDYSIGGKAKTSFALLAQFITEYHGIDQDYENLVRLLDSPMIAEISQILQVKFITGLIPFILK